jgi:hypothetical protein
MKRGQAPPPCGGSCLDAGRTRHCCLRKSGVLVWLGPFICFERDPKSVHTAHPREMPESFAATFSLSDTLSQRLNRKAWANHSAVLKAVGNRRCKMRTGTPSILVLTTSWVKALPENRTKRNRRLLTTWLSRFAVDGHPIRARA